MPGDTSHTGVYDLVYNSAGTLLSATRLAMDSIYYVTAATIDPVNNKLFVCGRRNQGIYPLFLSFAAAFDESRNTIWLDTAGNNVTAINSVAYDKMGHL